jgi:uncharacterized protein
MAKSNAVGWFDIYVDNIDRATKFYETVLQQKLKDLSDPTGETKMRAFEGDMTAYGASGALVHAKHAKPGAGGTAVYFSVADCAVEEARVVPAGGKVLRPKFSIGEFGWVTMCLDSEGNVFGLSSMK